MDNYMEGWFDDCSGTHDMLDVEDTIEYIDEEMFIEANPELVYSNKTPVYTWEDNRLDEARKMNCRATHRLLNHVIPF